MIGWTPACATEAMISASGVSWSGHCGVVPGFHGDGGGAGDVIGRGRTDECVVDQSLTVSRRGNTGLGLATVVPPLPHCSAMRLAKAGSNGWRWSASSRQLATSSASAASRSPLPAWSWRSALARSSLARVTRRSAV
jgi:hypothetical protein